MKFEVRAKGGQFIETYGVYNNDMKEFQYITEWNSTETIHIEEAIKACNKRNNK